jgi:SAM-dependent methyltransferase
MASLEQLYDAYGEVEEQWAAALDESLDPRGPDFLYDLVAGFGLAAGSVALDVGCGDGRHSVELAERFGFAVTGIDPVERQVEVARGRSVRAGSVRFELGSAEERPVARGSVDLVWCREALVHMADLERAFAEFRRVLRPGGRALVYEAFGTDRLEPRETEWLSRTLGVVPASFDPKRTEAAIAASGLRLDDRLVIGTEWSEWAEERSGKPGRKLLRISRLLRNREAYVARFGEEMYEIALADCLWTVYLAIGKLDRRAYVLSG